jgi:AcrR family transcriptional regulator
MGTADRRERERLELRTRILDASRRLFAENGYEAVTLRSIAEAIEYSPRTIYLHFKDKEDLLRQLCLQDFRVFGESMARNLAVQDPIQRLLNLGQSYAEFAITHPNHYALMFMSPPAVPPQEETPCGAGDPEADAYALLVGSVQEAIARGLFKPEFQDPDLVAQMLWAGTHGIVSQHLTRTGEGYVPWRPVGERVSAMGQLMISGLLRHETPANPEPTPKRKKS